MAYLILNEDGPEIESGYFEFDPENKFSLERIEAMLAERSDRSARVVDQIGKITAESFLQNGSRPIGTGILNRIFCLLSSVFVKKSSSGSNSPHRSHRVPNPGGVHKCCRENMSFVS